MKMANLGVLRRPYHPYLCVSKTNRTKPGIICLFTKPELIALQDHNHLVPNVAPLDGDFGIVFLWELFSVKLHQRSPTLMVSWRSGNKLTIML
jgi:hypothetical protein